MRPIHCGMAPLPAYASKPFFGGVSTYDPETGTWSDEIDTDGTGDRWSPGDSELGEKPDQPMTWDEWERRQPGLQIVPVTETPTKDDAPFPFPDGIPDDLFERTIIPERKDRILH